jgi:hypothetical protein
MSKKNLNEGKKKLISVPYKFNKPSKSIIKELETFIEYVPPQRLSRNLRNLFLEFLPFYIKHSVPTNFETITTDLHFLLEFLDKLGDEIDKKK